MYSGGGVAIGDINNDGLQDIFFTGNMVKNKLYLNKGQLAFADVSIKSNIEGDERWYTGVTMVDINSDGWLDIYVSVSGKGNSKNQLYVNNKDLTFSEKAKEFGIDDASNSIQSTFFDYDNDGDLDLFVGNYPLVPLSMGNQFYFNKIEQNEIESSGHLFRNNGNDTFTNVTKEAGVQNFGLTLGLVSADFNNDGWQDFYVSNDFQVPDYLYLNNRNGTFSEVLKKSVQHTSLFGMGIDASDFNNDGLIDFLQLDMAPEDYKRSKMDMSSMNSKSFQEIVDLGGHYQYMENSLQFNNGNDKDGVPVFSNISRLAGIATTDWSWGVLFADFDNDGNKDVVITNGIFRDVNNKDVGSANKYLVNPQKIKLGDFPREPLNNFLYQNQGDLEFKNISKSSGFDFKGYTNGLAYGDLDNDGDLDLVLNNLDDKALIFENKTKSVNNFIEFSLKGHSKNPLGIGTRIVIKVGDKIQLQELTLTRGFQSSVAPIIHFGLGTDTKIDEAEVTWPDGTKQILTNVKVNQKLLIEKHQTVASKLVDKKKGKVIYQFKDITLKSGIYFKHKEDNYDDFAQEPLLPHKNSAMGPGMTVGDVNNDGLDDFFIGNASGSKGTLFIQQEDLTFAKKKGPWELDANFEDTGALFFDADGDGDLDLYVVSGGNDSSKSTSFFEDRLYINNEGNFTKTTNVLPKINSSGQVVISADFDKDGDLDLFVGGRIVPGHYPYPASSYILRNDGIKEGYLKFTDVTKEIAPDLIKCGLVTSALWQDYNNDGKLDLIVTGEWMPIRFFKNKGGVFTEDTANLGMDDTIGWWYALKSVDIDQDGDLDLVAGNLGLNYKYQTNKKSPFEIYSYDFDRNGKSDIVLSFTKNGEQLPVRGKECSSQQVPAISKRFETYKSFADANLSDIYGKSILEKSLKYKANTFAHYWIENDGKGKFIMHQLPTRTQFSSVNAIEIIDINGDVYPDFLMAGNLYNAEVETPRNDASIGLILESNPSLQYNVQSSNDNKLIIKGEVKNIQIIHLGRKGNECYLFGINNGSVKLISKELK
jgi:hypothetical protein